MIQPELRDKCLRIRDTRGSIVSSTPVCCCHDSIAADRRRHFSPVLFSAADSRAQGSSGTCEDAAELAVLPSPIAPWKGAPLRVVFAAEKPLEGELSLIAPDGSVAAKSRERHGGPPYFWFAEVESPAAGTWRATLARDRAPAGCSTITRDIAVRADQPPPPSATPGSVWPLRNTWNRATENLFSAWIEKLFDAPLDAELSWPALHEVLRDRSRNFLFNHLGLGEDEMKMILRPDCADLPYFLARVFRVQDGAAVRVLEMHARRRRQAAEMPAVVEHSESRSRLAAAHSRRTPHRGDRTRPECFDGPRPRLQRRRTERTCAEAAGARGGVRRIFADRRRRRSFRIRANGGERQQHRLLSRAAQAGDAAPGDRLRRSVRARPDDRAARAAVGRRGGRHSRRRRAARRDGRAQALLARQFPVRPGSRARRPRVQALPADRAREERRVAAADQRRNREKSAVRRFFARSVAARGRRLLRSNG